VGVRLFCLLLSFQIRVNAVNPTVVLTDMGRKAWNDPDVIRAVIARIPLRRFAGILHIKDIRSKALYKFYCLML